MKKYWKIICKLFAILEVCIATTNNVQFFCLRHTLNTVRMELEIWNDNEATPISLISGVDQDTDSAIAGCSTDNVITGSGISSDPNKLIVIVTDLDDGTTDVDCGHKRSGDGNMIYTWVFRMSSGGSVNIDGLTFGADGDEIISCDFYPVMNPVIDDSPNVENQAGMIEEQSVKPFVEEVEMIVSKPVHHMKMTVADFASDAILLLRLIPSEDGGAVGITAADCYACPTSSCDTDTVQIIDSDGCEVSSEGVFQPGSNSGFYSTPDLGLNIGAETVYSNVFNVFRFSTGDFVYFKCTVLYCYTYDDNSGNPYCDDHCNYNTKRKRKKRSIAENTTSTVVRVPKLHTVNTSSVLMEKKDFKCMSHPTVAVIIPVLGVLSLILTAIAFVCCGLLIHHSRIKKPTL